jgi:hypothetical protein
MFGALESAPGIYRMTLTGGVTGHAHAFTSARRRTFDTGSLATTAALHTGHRIDGVQLYALVLFETFSVTAVLVFPLDALTPICAALGKRHPRQDELIQFTRTNWWTIRNDTMRFQTLGITVWLPTSEQ